MLLSDVFDLHLKAELVSYGLHAFSLISGEKQQEVTLLLNARHWMIKHSKWTLRRAKYQRHMPT